MHMKVCIIQYFYILKCQNSVNIQLHASPLLTFLYICLGIYCSKLNTHVNIAVDGHNACNKF
jgi:hypothetical protein